MFSYKLKNEINKKGGSLFLFLVTYSTCGKKRLITRLLMYFGIFSFFFFLFSLLSRGKPYALFSS